MIKVKSVGGEDIYINRDKINAIIVNDEFYEVMLDTGGLNVLPFELPKEKDNDREGYNQVMTGIVKGMF